jgi:hypothetical protein
MMKRDADKAASVDARGNGVTATAARNPTANSYSRPKRSNVAYSSANRKQTMKMPKHSTAHTSVARTKDVPPDPIELMVGPKGSKRRKQAAAASAKLDDIRPDVPPSSSLQPDPIVSAQPIQPPSSSAIAGPVPDQSTSLSNTTATTTSSVGRSILHIKHKTGEVLGTYKSCYAAAKSVGISRHIVDSIVKGIYKVNHYKGWTFRYATGEEEAPAVDTSTGSNGIEQVDVATGNVIATFRYVLAASKETGVARKDISSMVNSDSKSKSGWSFRFVTDKTISPDVVRSEPPDSFEPVAPDLSNDLDLLNNMAEESIDDKEPLDYKVHMITVTDHGSLGIVAKKIKAPEAVLSLVDLFDGDSADSDDMNLCIDSFIGTDSIAEKFGMYVGDFLFLSYMYPIGGAHEEQVYGKYKSVAYFIRRKPRPTTFYVVRSKSIAIPSINAKVNRSLHSERDDAFVEDLDPMNDLEKNLSDYGYHPIILTKSGPLGIEVVKRKSLPKGVETIPYFSRKDEDCDKSQFCEFSMEVESLMENSCLALQFGIQAGDYLVLPHSEHTPAMFNYQEAYYIDTYKGVRDAIENGDRPLTLYAIRLKSEILDVPESQEMEGFANIKTKNGHPIDTQLTQSCNYANASKEKGLETAKKVLLSDKKADEGAISKNTGESTGLNKQVAELDLPINENVLTETPEYKLLEIVITEHGSIGIMARKTEAPDAVYSLRWNLPGALKNLQIDSFIGTNSIAEKSGMQVGDYLFLSRQNPVGQDLAFEEMKFGDYDDVAFYIRRDPRPTTFYVARSKSIVAPSISIHSQSLLSSSDMDEELVEDMDPLNDMEENCGNCTYHPIVLSETGPLGIVAMKAEDLPDDYDRIPYFWVQEDDYARCGQGLDFDEVSRGNSYFQVKSLVGKDCLARKVGLQPGDYLMRPSSDYTPAAFNYQEAFFVFTSFEGICNAIKCKVRPLTLYAIRSKSESNANEITIPMKKTQELMKATADSSGGEELTEVLNLPEDDAQNIFKEMSEPCGKSHSRESSDYEVLKITVTEDGSMGIMAQRTKAPYSVASLVDLFDRVADDEMNLRIDSFIGTNSIAEKFGMKIGDYLFLSYVNPLLGTREEILYGEYKCVSYYIRRDPRPTTFYVVRLKSNVIRSTSIISTTSLPSDSNDELVEDMDPLKFMGTSSSTDSDSEDDLWDSVYSYHPITITECGPLGIKTKKKYHLDQKDYDNIPFFFYLDTGSHSDWMESAVLEVKSVGKKVLLVSLEFWMVIFLFFRVQVVHLLSSITKKHSPLVIMIVFWMQLKMGIAHLLCMRYDGLERVNQPIRLVVRVSDPWMISNSTETE